MTQALKWEVRATIELSNPEGKVKSIAVVPFTAFTGEDNATFFYRSLCSFIEFFWSRSERSCLVCKSNRFYI